MSLWAIPLFFGSKLKFEKSTEGNFKKYKMKHIQLLNTFGWLS